MKKVCMAMALCLVCAMFISCGNKKDKAVEYLKNTLESPASFDLVDIDDGLEIDAQTSYDTLYHVGKCYEHEIFYSRYIDSVYVDSIEVWRTEYPACSSFSITYDAANSYGVIIRKTKDIWYVNGEGCFTPEEFVQKYTEEKKLDYKGAYMKTFKNVISRYVEEGEWTSPYNLGTN